MNIDHLLDEISFKEEDFISLNLDANDLPLEIAGQDPVFVLEYLRKGLKGNCYHRLIKNGKSLNNHEIYELLYTHKFLIFYFIVSDLGFEEEINQDNLNLLTFNKDLGSLLKYFKQFHEKEK